MEENRLLGKIDAQVKILLEEHGEMRDWLQNARRDTTANHAKLYDTLAATNSAVAELTGKFELYMRDVDRRISSLWMVCVAASASLVGLIGALKIWG